MTSDLVLNQSRPSPPVCLVGFYPRRDGSITLFLSSKTLSPKLTWSVLSYFLSFF